MKYILIIIFIGLFLSSCGYRTIRHLNNGTCVVDNKLENDVEWCRGELEDARRYEKYQREQAAEEARRIKEEQDEDDSYPVYKLCMMWDGFYDGSSSSIHYRERIAQSLERRGKDPLYCRNTSNSNDAARRSEDKANQAIINSNEAKRRAIQAEQQAYEAEQRAIAQRRRQQQQQQNQDLYQPQPSTCVYPEC
jgi:hypothetical protein